MIKIKISKKLKLKMIFPNSNFKDKRGFYLESFNLEKYKKKLKVNFVEDDFSINKKKCFQRNSWR